MIGRTIAHYQILEKLGEGGMGVVYKARDTHLDRFVAIKLLPPERVADPERKRRFVQEAKAASALNHPNIITIHDIAHQDGMDFMVMEYVAGKTLDQLIGRKGLKLEETLKYGIQIADALARAHSAGIIHRDLKPSNIMVDDHGLVKVLDFGLAKLTESVVGPEAPTQTAEGAILGTVAYMSPEQAQGKKLDCRSDIFSFGAVLYEMLSGRRAFPGDSSLSILAGILREEPAPLWEVPPEAPSIVRRCLRKDPAERFQSAGELKRALERPASAGESVAPAIAVLPFANLSADKENEYFSDGLAEEVINALTQLPGLRVTARTSAFALRGKDLDVREIGARLGVGHVLEGSVRKAGNRIRVTAQLINVADGYHLWSQRFDREMTDVFAIQDEICQAIVDKLRLQLAGGRPLVKRYTENLEAYNLFLKGRCHVLKFSTESLAKGRQCFEQAIAEDPDYPLPYLGLAMFYHHAGIFGLQAPKEVRPPCQRALAKALELDAQLPEAHAMLGVLRAADYDWEGARREFSQAVELAPDSPEVSAPYDYYWLVPMRRLDEAVDASRRALALDPLSPFLHWRLAYRFYLKRQFDRAIEWCHKALELDSGYLAAHNYLGLIYLHQGLLDEGLRALETAAALSPGLPILLGHLGFAYGKLGRTQEARKLLQQLEAAATERYVPPSSIAWIHFGLGETDRAFEWFQKAVEEHDGVMLHFHVDPSFDPLRSDPRYHALLRKMNLAP